MLPGFPFGLPLEAHEEILFFSIDDGKSWKRIDPKYLREGLGRAQVNFIFFEKV